MIQARGLVLEQVYGQKKTALWEWTWINVSIDEEDLLDCNFVKPVLAEDIIFGD